MPISREEIDSYRALCDANAKERSDGIRAIIAGVLCYILYFVIYDGNDSIKILGSMIVPGGPDTRVLTPGTIFLICAFCFLASGFRAISKSRKKSPSEFLIQRLVERVMLESKLSNDGITKDGSGQKTAE